MSKLDIYSQAFARCIAMAKSSGEEEIRLMWLNLAEDYRYLLDLEHFSFSQHTPAANSGKLALAVQQSVVFGGNNAIAVAGRRLEAVAVDDGNAAARIIDQPRLLQNAGGHSDGRPVHAEHLGKKFLRQRE